ncbi:uncharacterized protein LOC123261081 [Cotesia glomerata]|uniref:Coiled-coil domain-containing protein 51 n=1 Tax=Cotesia glomerata TaxID=32391 RepID=A0AAV7IFT6_COTGL|nr:uncharacterized protein LOC123261081 [Cotesia glomerata]KAH0550543.1 hypothetical protein KQX54_020098 [Cotesia glomerata]
MTSRSKKLLDVITSRFYKSPVLTSAIESATERAHMQLTNFQNIANKKYDTIIKQVNGTTIIQDLKSGALEPTPMPKQLVLWWKWYQQLTGLEDVELARQQMIAVQDKLFDCQNRRRVLNNQASLIADNLKQVYGELIQTKREDPKYVQLTIMENKALQEQGRIISQLNLLENEERDHFTQLATAIKEYHDSQNINAQKYKYLSILASAIIAILSLGGSMIYNNKRISDVHKIIAEGQTKNENIFKSYFSMLENSIEKINKQKVVVDSIKPLDNSQINLPSVEIIEPAVNYDINKTVVIGGALALFFIIFNRLYS